MRKIMTTWGLVVLVSTFVSLGVVSAQATGDAEIAKSNADLSRSYAAEKYDDALKAAVRLVDLISQKYGNTHLQAGQALKNRGYVEYAMGDTKQAAETFEDAVAIFKKQNDLDKKDGLGLARMLEILAAIKMKTLLVSGESYLDLAATWREKSGNGESAEMATTLATLGYIKFWSHDYKASSELFKRSMLILPKLTGDETSEMRSLVIARAQCSFRKADIEDQYDVLLAEYKSKTSGLPVDGKPNMVSGGVINGKALSLAKPSYPDGAKKTRAGGSISVQVLIGEKGEVLSACTVGKANPYLAEASEIAAYGSKFSPTLLKGSPVKVSGVITYNFVP